jgi:autotransporter-associated beta strand protein
MVLMLSLGAFRAVDAGSATWKLNPITGDWNTAGNWDPPTVPNQSTDVATFDASSTTQISISFAAPDRIDLDSMVFNPGASAYTVTAAPTASVYLDGAGIINNSGVTQNLVTQSSTTTYGYYSFSGNAAIVGPVIITNSASQMVYPGGEALFNDASSAGEAIIINEGGAAKQVGGGVTIFTGSATAANAAITVEGGKMPHSHEAQVNFNENSTAGNAIITATGGRGFRSTGGTINFRDGSTAGHALITATGGERQGGAAVIFFWGDSTGGSAQARVFANAKLNFAFHNNGPPGPSIGSLEGQGLVQLKGRLQVGSNNISTIFSGQIVELNGVAGLHKVGTGRLILTGDNIYSNGTTIDNGLLEVSNQTGSGTGSGPVQVKGGKLSGEGFIGGAVRVGRGAALDPGRSPTNPRTLTMLSTLEFENDAIYDCDLNSDTTTADQAIANGVIIDAGAVINLTDAGTATLTAGTTLTLISNTSATAITSTFSNLADGATITAGANTYQANYEGGDGNDLTLTVIQ